GAVAVEFDPAGRRAAMTDAAGTVAYDHDGLGRLTAVRRAGGPALALTYDTQDRPASLAVGDDHAVAYAYDFLGRPAAIDTPAGRVAYAYSAKDRSVTRTLPNGVRTTRAYSPAGRLDRIEHATAAGDRLTALAYEYRPDGLIRAVKESSPAGDVTTTYEYDTVGRLVAATDSRGRRSAYTYDPLGNRLAAADGDRAETCTFDWAGRLVGRDGQRTAHDPAGNLARYAGDRGPLTLAYSAAGQLVAASAGPARVGLLYDGDGNLVAREAGGGRTTFVPDPRADAWRPLLATDARGDRTAYLWDGDALLAVREGGAWRFVLPDHLGSVRWVVDAVGAVVGRPGYDPFGRPRADPGGEFGPGFAGLFYDRATGLYLTKARAYDPALGRFLQPDPEHRVPAGSQKDLIAYTYCGNDPVNFADPNGCQPGPYGPGPRHGPPLNALQHLHRQDALNQALFRLSAQQATDERNRRHLDLVNRQLSDSQRLMQWQNTTLAMQNQLAQINRMQDFQLRALQAVPAGATRPPIPNPPSNSALAPGRVGGVALSGGAAALDGFGRLDGVALDDNGRLVLLSAGAAEVELPPLRLDDLVTVFRSVYDHGEAPSVSIDPDPVDPNGPVMHVRHGPGTENTYVGWVLFEADRVMKTYSLGQDNLTGRPFRSKIAGYDKHLSLRFADAPAAKDKRRWERFWIVPAAVTHKPAKDGRTALLSVPLKLRTEAMVMKGGKLDTAPDGKSSRGAEYFTKWFTDNYDRIAAESRSRPPAGTGMAGEVAVFAELKRVAAVAAAAERLRDTGVPMPGWMRDYPVRPFPFPATTPATTVTSSKTAGNVEYTYSIYGGVTLSPPPEAVRTEPSAEADRLAPR
ncbi:MAG: hypothetical protein K2X87_21175, partial [Gemmataceae bacterium]|nr:hypothetical protein [Gemmataceae bacterium]